MRRLSQLVQPLLQWAKRRALHVADSAASPEAASVTRGSRSNFYYAFLFMPKARRRAIYNVYAYCPSSMTSSMDRRKWPRRSGRF